MSRRAIAAVLACAAACGDDGGATPPAVDAPAVSIDAATTDAPIVVDVDAAGPDAGPGTRPHPLYPALDLDTLPGAGGAAGAPYQPPAVPVTTRTITIVSTGGQAATDLTAACATAGTAVTVPDAAGALGTVFLGDVSDCDVTLGPAVVINILYLGHVNTPAVAPVHRVRVRGGQLGRVLVDPGSTDLVFDGVVVNNAVVPPAQRASTGFFLIGDRTGVGPVVDRFAVVNSIVREVAVTNGAADDGAACYAQGARNVFFAGDNIVTGGNRNSWAFLVGGGKNALFVDLTVRVSHDAFVRLEDGAVDYVHVRGGTWMHEDTGAASNDSFYQRDDFGTDHVFVHDATVWMLPSIAVAFGASAGPGQAGKQWEARRLHWHAPAAGAVSDDLLTSYQGHCVATAACDYGVGTHTYQYDPAAMLPADAWRDLPAFADDDPDHQPVVP